MSLWIRRRDADGHAYHYAIPVDPLAFIVCLCVTMGLFLSAGAMFQCLVVHHSLQAALAIAATIAFGLGTRAAGRCSALSCMMWLGVFLLAPIVLVATCTAVRGKFPRWVHPSVEGTVVDARTGEPIENATVAFVRSRFGGGATRTDEEGRYRLKPVTELRRFSLTGDPYYATFVEAPARGYVPVGNKTGHGTGEVVESRGAPKRYIEFQLNEDSPGVAVEYALTDDGRLLADDRWLVPIDEQPHALEPAAGPDSDGTSSPPAQ